MSDYRLVKADLSELDPDARHRWIDDATPAADPLNGLRETAETYPRLTVTDDGSVSLAPIFDDGVFHELNTPLLYDREYAPERYGQGGGDA